MMTRSRDKMQPSVFGRHFECSAFADGSLSSFGFGFQRSRGLHAQVAEWGGGGSNLNSLPFLNSQSLNLYANGAWR